MIYVRLEGGLGNQLFQYAAGRAYSLSAGQPLTFDTSQLNKRIPGVTTRALELRTLVSGISTVDRSPLRLASLALKAPRLVSAVNALRVITDARIAPSKFLTRTTENAYLVGYWQSENYFHAHLNTICADIQPTTRVSKELGALIAQLRSCDSVSVHVRRGDYVSNPHAASYHGALGLAYYKYAIKHVRDCVPTARFYVFSDDPDWCRANLLPLDSTLTILDGVRQGWEDVTAMRAARHHIIANSSFSWWAAWLSRNDRLSSVKGLAIAPSKWFARGPCLTPGERTPVDWMLM